MGSMGRIRELVGVLMSVGLKIRKQHLLEVRLGGVKGLKREDLTC